MGFLRRLFQGATGGSERKPTSSSSPKGAPSSSKPKPTGSTTRKGESCMVCGKHGPGDWISVRQFYQRYKPPYPRLSPDAQKWAEKAYRGAAASISDPITQGLVDAPGWWLCSECRTSMGH